MKKILTKILSNKPEYFQHIEFLDKKYNSIFTKNLLKEKNEINILSQLCEIEFGIIINNLFIDITYEPTINKKKPDWLVISNDQKIIFEVKNVNPNEKEIQKRINLVKEDKYSGLTNKSFTFTTSDFQSQISKITEKETTYRNLITCNDYKLIICFDVSNLQDDFITDTDIKQVFDFENKYSLINKFPDFCKNVAGIIVKPIFPSTIFIENKKSNFKLNQENLKILKTINYP